MNLQLLFQYDNIFKMGVIKLLVVGLNGSPRKTAAQSFYSDTVLNKVKELGAETVVYDVQELLNSAKHSFCVVCSSPCSGICYKDSKLEEAFEVMKKADAIVFGSPSYFGTVSGQLKAFLTRRESLGGEKALYNKVGAGVTVGGSKIWRAGKQL